MRERLSISQYLTNFCDMMCDWSKDRIKIKPFYEVPKVDGDTWSLAYHALYTSIPIVRTTMINSEEFFILTKDEHKQLINLKIIQGKYHQISLDFDSFIESMTKIKIIRLIRSKWSDSICSCYYYMRTTFAII